MFNSLIQNIMYPAAKPLPRFSSILPYNLLDTLETDYKLLYHIVHSRPSTAKPGYNKTITFPMEYYVDADHITIATEIYEQQRAKIIADNVNNIVFTGMGMEFKPSPGYANNYRFRAEFTTNTGILVFVEFTTTDAGVMSCDHSIDRSLEERWKKNPWINPTYNNYKGLERSGCGVSTYENILNLINTTFDCDFDKVVIDNYLTNVGDCINKSPNKSYQK